MQQGSNADENHATKNDHSVGLLFHSFDAIILVLWIKVTFWFFPHVINSFIPKLAVFCITTEIKKPSIDTIKVLFIGKVKICTNISNNYWWHITTVGKIPISWSFNLHSWHPCPGMQTTSSVCQDIFIH